MKLEDCMAAIIDYRGRTPTKNIAGIPLITAKIVKGGRIADPEEFIAEDDYDQWMTRGLPLPGDVVLTTEAPLGEVAQLDSRKLALAQRIITLRGKPGLLDNTYLRFALQGSFVQSQLSGRASGSTVAGIKQSELRKVDLPLPDFGEQLAIAHILGTLDDKIELNRRTNETLEAIARTLFKDWFIDFSPVRAKMEGRDPYLAREVWDLFPERLNSYGLPQEWINGKLGDIASSRSDGVLPSQVEPETPYIGLEHMPRRSIAISDWDRADKVDSNKVRFSRGDFLFGKLRPYFHKVGVAPIGGICSTDIVVLRSIQNDWSAFVLLCISSDEFVAFADKSSTGTKMPRTSWGIMSGYTLCLPQNEIARAYQFVVAPLMENICTNIHEIRELSNLRNALLPKLISGELRIQDTERFIAEVAS